MSSEKTATAGSCFLSDNVASDGPRTLAWGRMGQRSPASSESRRAPVFRPASGPSGTDVTVRVQDLPALTPIYLRFGAARSILEVLAELVTDQQGRTLEAVVAPLQTGDVVAVTATLSEASICQQGTTLEVIRVGG